MNPQSPEFIGTGLMISTALLAAYYLVLKIKESHSERPDPKLTYATQAHLERTRSELMQAITEVVKDVRSLRSEIRHDIANVQTQYSQSLTETRELISKNAQNISALIAQAQLSNQRIAELNLRTDKISMRTKKEQ